MNRLKSEMDKFESVIAESISTFPFPKSPELLEIVREKFANKEEGMREIWLGDHKIRKKIYDINAKSK